MDKLRFVARRLLQGLAALLLIAVINFLLIRAAPGRPGDGDGGRDSGAADEVYLQQLRKR